MYLGQYFVLPANYAERAAAALWRGVVPVSKTLPCVYLELDMLIFCFVTDKYLLACLISRAKVLLEPAKPRWVLSRSANARV